MDVGRFVTTEVNFETESSKEHRTSQAVLQTKSWTPEYNIGLRLSG